MSFRAFGDGRTQKVIHRFGNPDNRKVMVFVGAGASVEAGLPTWEALTKRLLYRAAIETNHFPSMEAVDAWVDTTMRTQSLQRAASIAEDLLTQDLPEVLKQELFLSDLDPSLKTPRDFEPGPIAKEIAHLREVFEEKDDAKLRLLTTNYDDLLEVALSSRPGLDGYTICPWVGPDASAKDPKRPIKVRHLHGFIGRREGVKGEIVLTEDSMLVRDADTDDWRHDEVRGFLRDQPCLFIGTSLQDFNVTRYLQKGLSSHQHAVVFVRQAEEQQDEPTQVRKLREEAAIQRWGRRNLDVIFLDHFADVAQLLNEIATRAKGNGPTEHLNVRVPRFIDLAHQAVIKPHNAAAFRKAQNGLNKALCVLRDQLVKEMAARKQSLKKEHLTLAIWLVDPSGETMTNWVSTDRINTDPTALQPIHLDVDSRWVAAQAACAGARVDEQRDYRDTRWSYIVALPLFARLGGKVPVGVATISSLAPMHESKLATLPPKHQAFLESLVLDGVCDLFVEKAGNKLQLLGRQAN